MSLAMLQPYSRLRLCPSSAPRPAMPSPPWTWLGAVNSMACGTNTILPVGGRRLRHGDALPVRPFRAAHVGGGPQLLRSGAPPDGAGLNRNPQRFQAFTRLGRRRRVHLAFACFEATDGEAPPGPRRLRFLDPVCGAGLCGRASRSDGRSFGRGKSGLHGDTVPDNVRRG